MKNTNLENVQLWDCQLNNCAPPAIIYLVLILLTQGKFWFGAKTL